MDGLGTPVSRCPCPRFRRQEARSDRPDSYLDNIAVRAESIDLMMASRPASIVRIRGQESAIGLLPNLFRTRCELGCTNALVPYGG